MTVPVDFGGEEPPNPMITWDLFRVGGGSTCEQLNGTWGGDMPYYDEDIGQPYIYYAESTFDPSTGTQEMFTMVSRKDRTIVDGMLSEVWSCSDEFIYGATVAYRYFDPDTGGY